MSGNTVVGDKRTSVIEMEVSNETAEATLRKIEELGLIDKHLGNIDRILSYKIPPNNSRVAQRIARMQRAAAASFMALLKMCLGAKSKSKQTSSSESLSVDIETIRALTADERGILRQTLLNARERNSALVHHEEGGLDERA